MGRPHSGRPTRAGDQVFYYVQDAAPGNVRALVTSGGTVAAAYAYEPWGRPEAVSEPGLGGWAQPSVFAGAAYDRETGLYHQRARYYAPRLGRFLSQDPIGLGGGVNWYAYAGGDPVNSRDPTGLDYGCDASYWSYNQAATRSLDGSSLSPWSEPYNWTYHPNAIACRNPDPGVPALPGAGPGQGGATIGPSSSGPRVAPAAKPANTDRIRAFFADACNAAAATVAADVLGGTLTVMGAWEVRGAALALRGAGAALTRAEYFAAMNGGRASIRRLGRTTAAYTNAAFGFETSVGVFGATYAAGAYDDIMRGGGWKALVPFANLPTSIPGAIKACK